MNVFVVYAHPEPLSFTGAMRSAAEETLAELGHDVVVSDLYAMGFNPVPGWHDFVDHDWQEYFGYEAEQRRAAEYGSFAPDISAEMAKLQWCDLLILQFPLWWYGLPAVLKGWVDRVFAAGFAYGGGRWFDRGTFVGRKALLTLTTGGSASGYGPDGLQGDIETILFPIHRGILQYTGFEVYPPFVAYAASYGEPAERELRLEEFRDRLRELEKAPVLNSPRLEDYDERLRLRSKVG